MYTNKLNDIFKGVHFLDKTAGRRSATLPKNVPSQVFSIIFAQIYSFLHRVSQNLQISVSQKTFQYRLLAAAVLENLDTNGILIVLKWQNIHVISKLKYTAI